VAILLQNPRFDAEATWRAKRPPGHQSRTKHGNPATRMPEANNAIGQVPDTEIEEKFSQWFTKSAT
jgi:hypothetical protein